MENLRRAAEAKMTEGQALRAASPEAGTPRFQHELEIHQIELELQNHELRAAQSEHAAALARYTDLFDHAPVGYFDLDTDGTMQLVNLTGAKFIGHDREQLIGRRLGLFVAAEDRKVFGELLTHVFATGMRQTCELALETEGRPPLTVRVEATVSPDAKECRAVMTDVTDQRRAEKALLASASLTDDVLNSLLDHVVVLDEKGTIIAVNESWRSFAWKNGASTDFLGENYLAVCHRSAMGGNEFGPEQTEEGIRATLDGKLVQFVLEYPCDSPEEQRWFRLRVAPLTGEQRGVVISHHDISAPRKAEMLAQKSLEALVASKRQFKALFDQAAVGVALADVYTRKFVQVNRRYCEITGYHESELEQLKFTDINHPDYVDANLRLVEDLRTGLIREFTREKRYLRKDGTEIWVSSTVSAMWMPGEAPDLFIAVVLDITGRKALEEQVRQAQKMEAIGTLAGGIAHDFNNLLAAINGYTELSLVTLDGNPGVRSHLGAVLQATARATALVRQILAFSRQEKTARSPVVLGPIVAECVALLRATIPTTIQFEMSLAPDAPTVLADATQVHQVLMNLGTNAWHAMRDEPGVLRVTLARVVVAGEQSGDQAALRAGVYARISVSDTGCGMDAATGLRIFEPFFTTKPIGEGTGLGLAVVHGIMDKHEGVITVHSSPGKGSVFHLYFPETISLPEFPVDTEVSTPLGHGERLLVVDDEELLVEMMQLTLVELGYEVETATNPAAALERVRADPGRFDLVITDQTMPGMTGLALANQIQTLRPGLSIILTTGYMPSLTSEQSKLAGIRQLLPKPASLHAIATAIRDALAGREKR